MSVEANALLLRSKRSNDSYRPKPDIQPVTLLIVLFFVPLALGMMSLAWFAPSMSQAGQLAKFSLLSAFAWVAMSAILLLLIMVSAPHGELLHFRTLLAAYALPVLAIAAAVYSLGERISRGRLVPGGLIASAVAAALSPIFLLASTCVAQGNCL